MGVPVLWYTYAFRCLRGAIETGGGVPGGGGLEEVSMPQRSD